MKSWQAALGAVVLVAGAAEAALIRIDAFEVLDSKTGLVWLYDWGAAGTSDWQSQVNWAQSLTVGGVQVGSWALPSLDQYIAIFVNAGQSRFGLEENFLNVAPTNLFFTSTVVEGSDSANARWVFYAAGGYGSQGGINDRFGAVAVRPGDVVAPVPEPQTLALALLALGGLAAARRRKP